MLLRVKEVKYNFGPNPPRRRAKWYPFEGEAERMFGRGGSPANAGRPRRPTLHPQAEPKKI